MSAAEQVKTIETLEKRIAELELENKRLHDSVDYLTRKLFGRSSEKTSVLALGQMSLLFLMKQKLRLIQRRRNLN